MLSRLFKPKWKHPKSAIRLAAIGQLPGSDSEQQTILADLARYDPDDDVRAAAANKLVDPALLETLAATLPTARNRLADLLAGQIARGPALAERLKILNHIHDPAVLHHILEHGDAEMRDGAIAQFQDDADLTDIATHHPSAKVRLAAAQRVSQPEHLEHILKHSKNKDKGLYQLARHKLSQLRAEVRESRLQRQQSMEITESMEGLAKSEFSPLFAPRLKGLLLQWKQLNIAPGSDVAKRFENAHSDCREILARHQAAVAEQQSLNQAAQQINDCCAALENHINLLSKGETLDLERLEQLLTEQQQQWQTATALAEPTAYDQNRFKQAWLTLSAYQEATQTLQKHQARLTELGAQVARLNAPEDSQRISRTKKQLRQMLNDIHWPLQFRSPDILAQTHRHLERLAQLERDVGDWQSQQIPVVRQQLDELEHAVDGGRLKQAEQLVASIQNTLKRLPEKSTAALPKRLNHLKARVAELRDWRGFAATQQKEELCQRMEALIDNNTDPAYKADLIKQLQEQWKSLGYGDPSQAEALWERFKNASDQAFLPCREYFSRQRDNRKQNLAERQRISDQLESYLQQTDWSHVDWNKHQDIMRVARQEWNRYAPVERKPAKPVQDRFEGLMSELHSKLRQEQHHNLEKKRTLVRQAEGLVAQEDLAAAIDTAKQLQTTWKQIGPTLRSEDRRVWKAFRQACDALFARRDAQRQQRGETEEHNKTEAEALCQQVETYAALADHELSTKQDQLKAAVEAFNALGPLPKSVSSAITRRFNRAVNAFEKLLAGIPERQLITQTDEIMRKAELCEHMESLVQSEPDTVQQKIVALAAQWPSSLSLGHDTEQRLEQRFQQARQAVEARDAERLTAQWAVNLTQRELLCIRMELLAGLESPPEAREARMNYQLSRLNEAMLASESDRHTQLRQTRELVEQWSGTGAVHPNALQPLKARFKAGLDALLHHGQPAVANAG